MRKANIFMQTQIDTQNQRIDKVLDVVRRLCYTVIGIVIVVVALVIRELLGY